MVEALVIIVFLIALIGLTIKGQKEILFQAKRSKSKMILSIIIAGLTIVFFWTHNHSGQIKLIAFAMLIIIFGLTQEGLGRNRLIKHGLLSGEYKRYKVIQIETTKNGDSFVTFYKNKNYHFSMLLEYPEKEIGEYFFKNNFSGQVIFGDLPENIFRFK
ncbi:hypothetical protein P7D63_20315 [Enterococcus raffinosus]|uniref:hypothetical protein n=1 Tax=Enterococcus raffinosus TaxID=71452 RepID=UPI00288D7FAD|nr:hypothetical protein [Enterococcus raffinosus]MDT2557031.1 hypothetical protein [Enterococcus raffinosus]